MLEPTRSSAAQHRTQGRTAQQSTRHTAPSGSDENRETKRGGAATDGEQPPARRKARKRDKRTESREAEDQQSKQRTAPRPRAPGAGNQRKPETTGAHRGRRERRKKKKTPPHQAGATKTARHKKGGGGGRNHQRAANGQARDTNEARAHEEPGSGRPIKTTKAQHQGNEERQGQRERGGQPQPGGGQAKQKDKAAKAKGEAHHNALGRPARPTRPQRASTRTPAAVRMDECAPGGYPAPAGNEQPPSGWTSARPEGTQPLPATNSRRPDARVCARRVPSPCRLR